MTADATVTTEGASGHVELNEEMKDIAVRQIVELQPLHYLQKETAMSWCRLTVCERETIANLHFAGHGPREIGRRLNRAASTISGELRRNSVDARYRPAAAHQKSVSRRSQRPVQRKLSHPRLRSEVERLLSCCWSPDQVSDRLKREHPKDGRMHVSHQTIYRWLWSNPERVAEDLRHGRYRRRKKSTRTLIQNRVSIRR